MNKKYRLIVTYPGRFQLFGPHHYQVYRNLCKTFGASNVYITTSNHMDSRSPLSFREKMSVISKYGIDENNIVMTNSPYKPVELLKFFNENEDILIICYGQKDCDRINFYKKDGSESYYKRYHGQRNLEPFSKSGYAYQIPNLAINHNGNEICGTYLREIIPSMTPTQFSTLFGWYDAVIFNMLKEKFENTTIVPDSYKKSSKLIKTMEITNKRYTKHICHPYECINLTWLDLKEFILEVCQGNLPASQKYDGRNLQMTFKNGRVLASRNKGQVINPVDCDQIGSISKKEHVNRIFQEAFRVVESMMKSVDSRIFNNGKTFLNFEIIAPPYNVYSYPNNKIVLHNLITYDDLGNKVRVDSIEFKYPGRILDYEIVDSSPTELDRLVDWSLYENFEFYLNSLRLENRSNWGDTIELVSEEVFYNLRILILSVGNAIIKNKCIPYTKFQENDINNIIICLEKNIDDIYNTGDLKLIEKLQLELKKLNDLGGYSSINPMEGFVFNWKGAQLKLVGSFAPVNQILGMLRYKR